MDGKVHGRGHGASTCDNEQTTELWINAPLAYEGKFPELISPGPSSRESAHESEQVSASYDVLFTAMRSSCFCPWCILFRLLSILFMAMAFLGSPPFLTYWVDNYPKLITYCGKIPAIPARIDSYENVPTRPPSGLALFKCYVVSNGLCITP